MVDNNSKSNEPGAKLDATGPVSGGFNRESNRGERIASSLPETRRTISEFEETRDERLEKETKSQKRSKVFRVNKLKVEMLEKYITESSLRPAADEQTVQNDLKEIHYSAERIVGERGKFYLDNIVRESEKNIDQLLYKDQQTQREAGHEQPQGKSDPQHEHNTEQSH